MTLAAPNPPATNKPTSAYPKQAVIVIHGMGEQRPMDTLRGFVRTVWELDPKITANGLPNPAEVWSRPDMRTGSLELRRITTRQSIPTVTFPDGVRSDFYELYWADLSGGSNWGQVRDWIFGLLLRNPFTRVPGDVFLAWILLWMLVLAVVLFSLATVLPSVVELSAACLACRVGGMAIGCRSSFFCICGKLVRGAVFRKGGAVYSGDARKHRGKKKYSGAWPGTYL